MAKVQIGFDFSNNTMPNGTVTLAQQRAWALQYYDSQGWGIKCFGSGWAAPFGNPKTIGYGSNPGELNPLFLISGGHNATELDTQINKWGAAHPNDLIRICYGNEIQNKGGYSPSQWNTVMQSMNTVRNNSAYKSQIRLVYCGMAYQDLIANGTYTSDDYLTLAGGIVDEIGIDIYGNSQGKYGGNTQTYLSACLANSVALANKYHIPISIPENGVKPADFSWWLTQLDAHAYDPVTNPYGVYIATFWENRQAGTPDSPQPTDPKWSYVGTSALAAANSRLSLNQTTTAGEMGGGGGGGGTSGVLRGTNSATNDDTAALSLTVPVPAGVVAGDYAVLVTASQETSPSYTYSNNFTNIPVTPPASNTNRSLMVAGRTLSSGDLTSVTVSSTTSHNRSAVLYVFQVNAGQAVDVIDGTTGWTLSTSASAPSITPPQDDEPVVVVFADQSGTPFTFSTPTGFMKGPTTGPTATGGMSIAAFHQTDSGPSAPTGAIASTVSDQGNGIALTFSVGQAAPAYSDDAAVTTSNTMSAQAAGVVKSTTNVHVTNTIAPTASSGIGNTLRGTNSATNGGTASTSITIPMPPGTAAGDFAVLFVGGQDTTPSVTWSNSYSGLTLTTAASNTNRSLIAATKTLTSSDLTSVTASFTTSKIRSAVLFVFSASGRNIDVANGTVGWTGGTTGTAPSVVTTADDDSIITVFMAQAGSTFTWTTPTGYTSGPAISPSATGGAALAGFYKIDQGSAGATGTATTTTNAGNGVAITLGVYTGQGFSATANFATNNSISAIASSVGITAQNVSVGNAISASSFGAPEFYSTISVTTRNSIIVSSLTVDTAVVTMAGSSTISVLGTRIVSLLVPIVNTSFVVITGSTGSNTVESLTGQNIIVLGVIDSDIGTINSVGVNTLNVNVIDQDNGTIVSTGINTITVNATTNKLITATVPIAGSNTIVISSFQTKFSGLITVTNTSNLVVGAVNTPQGFLIHVGVSAISILPAFGTDPLIFNSIYLSQLQLLGFWDGNNWLPLTLVYPAVGNSSGYSWIDGGYYYSVEGPSIVDNLDGSYSIPDGAVTDMGSYYALN